MNNLSFKLILLFLLLPTYALFGKLSAESSVLEQTMVCPTGDLNFSTQAEVDAFPINYPNCTHIAASLVYISGPDITDLSPLGGIINIDGNLTISACPMLVSLSGLSGLVTLQGGLFIGYDNDLLTDIGLPNLVSIGTFLDIQFNSALTTLTGLENLLSVQDFWIFNNPELIDFGSSLVLTSIQNGIEIVGNPKLSNILGLASVADLGDYVNIDSNPELVSLQGLHNIALFNGDFIASNNAKLSTCAITSVCRHLSNGGTIFVAGNAPSGCNSQVEVENICDSIACNINVVFSGITHATAGSSNGSVTAQGTGASGNYTYAWSNSVGTIISTNATISGLAADTYSVTVRDTADVNCVIEQSVTITASGTQTCNISATFPLLTAESVAGANDGAVTAQGTGASGAYTYVWTNPAGAIISTTASISGLSPGIYSVTVRDIADVNCVTTIDITIAPGSPSSSGTPTQFIVCNVSGTQGSIVQVPIKVVNFNSVISFDMSFNIANTANARFVTPNPIGSPALTGISSGPNTAGQTNLIWIDSTGQTLQDSTVIFTIDVELLGPPGSQIPITIGGNLSATPEIVLLVNGSPFPTSILGVTGVSSINTSGNTSGICISGTIQTPSGAAIGVANADANGIYKFSNIVSGSNVTIKPFEDDNHSNGVNIGDMLKIARHIAHIEYFDSPLQLIAADVNRDGRVNSRDRSEIFQLVLGRESRFDNNTSWRFIPKTYTFPAATLPPLGQPGLAYPESITLNNVLTDTDNLDFWAVKIGDVDSMAILPRIAPFLEVNIGSMDIPMDDIPETITIPVKVNNFTDVAGIQFSLNWDPSILRYKGAKMMNLGGEVEQATVNSGTLKYVWSNETGTNESMPSNSTIFEAEFEVMSEQLIDAQRMVIKIPDEEIGEEPLSTAPLVIRDISNSTNLTRNASRSSQAMQSLVVSSPIQQGGVITINSTTIPTMSEWGLLIFGLLLLNLGVFLVQYKQKIVNTM